LTDYLIKKFTALLITDELDEYEAELLEYGITITFLNVPKVIAVLYIGKKLNLLKPLLPVMLFYGTIRHFSRGIHTKTPWGCFIVWTINYLGMAYVSTIIRLPVKVYNAIFSYCFCVYAKYAPSGTEVNPVYKDQIKPLKAKSLLIVMLYYFIGIKNGLLRNIAALSLLSQSISIIPLTYELSNQRGGMVHEEE